MWNYKSKCVNWGYGELFFNNELFMVLIIWLKQLYLCLLYSDGQNGYCLAYLGNTIIVCSITVPSNSFCLSLYILNEEVRQAGWKGVLSCDSVLRLDRADCSCFFCPMTMHVDSCWQQPWPYHTLRSWVEQ